MYKAFIEPDLRTAHIKIINKFNPFTGFQSPTYILKVSLCFIQFSVIHELVLIAIPIVSQWPYFIYYTLIIEFCFAYCSRKRM